MTDPTAPTNGHRVVVDLAEGLATSHNTPAAWAEAIAAVAHHLLVNRHALIERLDELGLHPSAAAVHQILEGTTW